MKNTYNLTGRCFLRSLVDCAFACILVLSASALSQSTCHQPTTRAWIRVADANRNSDTLWFGFDPSGTCGVDTQLCEWILGEPCGAPTDLFCVFWIVGDQCAPENQGTMVRYNYYAFRSPTQIDTFQVYYHPGPPDPRFPVKISWSRATVSALYDSIVIVDDVTEGALIKIRMENNDSLLVTDNRISILDLICYDAKPNSVNSVPMEMPKSLLVYQNYPNPFNPGTVIQYQIMGTTHVTLKVYNILGQETATLVNGMEEAGFKSVQFDGSNFSSGVYFYRLTAGTYTSVRKMVLIK